MRCLTITLNAAVDTTCLVERLVPGRTHRARRAWHMAGGKGNNVARVLAAYGHQVTATGLLGGPAGDTIERGLREAHVRPAFTRLARGASRTCHTILDATTGEATEVLEAGPEVTPADAERFLTTLPELVVGQDAVVVSGSVPVGIDEQFLARLVAIARATPCRLVVDSSGAALATLLAGQPDLVKPNAVELAEVMGRDAALPEQIAYVRNTVIPNQIAPGGRVLVSRGREGAVLVMDDAVLSARPPDISPVNTVGCGDALVAGYLDGWVAGMDAASALRQATAFGAAAALQPVAGVVDPRDVERFREQIQTKEMDVGR